MKVLHYLFLTFSVYKGSHLFSKTNVSIYAKFPSGRDLDHVKKTEVSDYLWPVFLVILLSMTVALELCCLSQ